MLYYVSSGGAALIMYPLYVVLNGVCRVIIRKSCALNINVLLVLTYELIASVD